MHCCLQGGADPPALRISCRRCLMPTIACVQLEWWYETVLTTPAGAGRRDGGGYRADHRRRRLWPVRPAGGSRGDFIEAGHRGRPAAWCFDHPPGSPERQIAEEWRAFKQRTGSEWWKIDYFDTASGEQYEAEGERTLDEVKRVFCEYLQGDDAWKQRYNWIRLKCCGS